MSRSRRVCSQSNTALTGDLVVAADREVVLALALARAVERQRRDAARQERLLVGVRLLLGGVETADHHHDRRARSAPDGLAQDAVRATFPRTGFPRARPADGGAAARAGGIRPPSCAPPSSAAGRARTGTWRSDSRRPRAADARRRSAASCCASASRPMRSCTRRAADQARHQSFQDAIEAVTSSKSASATPLATKRGAQWAIADLTRASVVIGVLAQLGFDGSSSPLELVAAVPRQEARGRLGEPQLEQRRRSRRQEWRRRRTPRRGGRCACGTG